MPQNLSLPAISFSEPESAPTDRPHANRPCWGMPDASSATRNDVTIFHPAPLERVSRIPDNGAGLQRTLRSVEDLMSEAEEDEYGPARPTEFAHRFAISLLRRAASLLSSFPAGSACTDVDAGIRITWREGERQVRLVLAPAPDGRSYVYMQDAQHPQITGVVTYDSVAGVLCWLDRGSEE